MNRPWFFPRKGEWWFGSFGVFFTRVVWGVEFPNGKFIGHMKTVR